MGATPRPWVIIPAFLPSCGDVGITAKGLPNVLAECFESIRHGSEKARDEATENATLIVKAVNAYDETQALLEELSDYFDEKQDCEIFTDIGYSPNAEMGFFLRVKDLLEGTK